MQRLVVPVALVLAAGFAQADPPKPSARNAEARITAEVVSVDRDAKTITLRSEASALESTTLAVQGKAIAALRTLEAGDTVTLACASGREGASLGQCEAVTALSKSRAHASAARD